MDHNDIRLFLSSLDEASTKARMIRGLADDLEKVLYSAQVMIAALQNELDGRGENNG